jgi:hypothetical protein
MAQTKIKRRQSPPPKTRLALPNERKTSTNGGMLAPALSMKALVS